MAIGLHLKCREWNILSKHKDGKGGGEVVWRMPEAFPENIYEEILHHLRGAA